MILVDRNKNENYLHKIYEHFALDEIIKGTGEHGFPFSNFIFNTLKFSISFGTISVCENFSTRVPTLISRDVHKLRKKHGTLYYLFKSLNV